MRREEKAVVLIAVQAGLPVMLWGPPGQGKSSFIRHDFSQLGYVVHVMRVNTQAPHQINGVMAPDLEQGTMRHLPPFWAVDLSKVQNGLLFLDDLSAASNASQTAALGILDERQLGELQLEAAIVAAANPDSLTTQRFALDAAVANRLVHVTITSDAQAYRDGILNGFHGAKVPVIRSNWRSAVRGKLELFTEFLCSAPGAKMLNKPPAQITEKTVAYPTERSWEMAAKVLAACDSITAESIGDLDLPEVRKLLFQGCVGEGAYEKFITSFVQDIDLQVNKALLQGRAFTFPTKGDQLFGLMWGISDRFKSKLDEQTWDQAWAVLEGLHNNTQYRDCGVSLALDLVGLNGGRFRLPEFYEREMRPFLEKVE